MVDFSMIPIENINNHDDREKISNSSKKKIQKDFKIDYEKIKSLSFSRNK